MITQPSITRRWLSAALALLAWGAMGRTHAQPLPYQPEDEGLEMVVPATPTPTPSPTATATPAMTETPVAAVTPAVTVPPVAAEAIAAPADVAPPMPEPAAITEPAITEPAAPALEQLHTRSRARFIHRITLYDENGQTIDPADPAALPYSPAMTCGKCHAVGEVNEGLHFNAGTPAGEGRAGRSGQPWFWSDPASGTVLPLSKRGWPGTFTPAAVGISDEAFTQRFGRHLPGGAPQSRDAVLEGRTALMGTLENDCMACHSADGLNDPQARAAQVAEMNLKWVPTATEGLGLVRGSVKALPEDYDPITAEVMGGSAEAPTISYDQNRFDANNRVLFNITREVLAERCEYCHTTTMVSEPSSGPLRWTRDGDVHLLSGIGCVDCHQHGDDHNMVRGYEGESGHKPRRQAQTLTCAGCHYGTDDAGRAAVRSHENKSLLALFDKQAATSSTTGRAAKPGRLGSPLPDHAGLPPIHFEKMTCTACHSGPEPGKQALAVQTALAHGLGLAQRHWPADADPKIATPVFLKNEHGQLAPHYFSQPAWWGLRAGETVTPLPLDQVKRVIVPALKAAGGDDAENKQTTAKGPNEAQVTAALAHAAEATFTTADDQPTTPGQPVYIANGLLHTLDASGKLVSEQHPAAEPIAWPMAHDVRPANQALGAKGCTECHADDAPIFYGQVAGLDSAALPGRGARPMYDVIGEAPAELSAWEMAFLGRPWLKVVGWGAFGLIGLTLLGYGAAGIRRLGRRWA